MVTLVVEELLLVDVVPLLSMGTCIASGSSELSIDWLNWTMRWINWSTWVLTKVR